MSTHPQTATRRPSAPARRAAARRRAVLRRRLVAGVGSAVLVAMAIVLAWPQFHHAVREITLPLRHEDIIRQQAHDKGLDPALIAAVIYTESHFRDGQTSAAGAQGLMQLTPATARYIAHKSGGTQFVVDDLGTPQVNIAYGAYYLRYLLRRYDGNVDFALAAYNAGEGKVDAWVGDAAARGETFGVTTHIPFAETRAYVTKVLNARKAYRRTYARELGL
jgi:peptidoglycan lytic transglycosylase